MEEERNESIPRLRERREKAVETLVNELKAKLVKNRKSE